MGIETVRPGYLRQPPQAHPPACWNCVHHALLGGRYVCAHDAQDAAAGLGLATAPDAVCDLHPRQAVRGAG